MATGTRTPDLPISNVIDDVVGNYNSGLGENTVRQPVSSLSAQLAASGAIADAIASLQGSQVGTYVFATLAALNANLNYPANTRAEVIADPTPANNGIYGKIGSSGTGSWSYISASLTATLPIRVSKTEQASAPLTLAFRAPLIWDIEGVLGGAARTLYIPQNIYFVKGSYTWNGLANSASANLPGYVAFVIPSGGAVTVYVDNSQPITSLYQTATYPSVVPNRINDIVVLADIFNNVVRTDLDIITSDKISGELRGYAPNSNIIVDGSTILIPAFRIMSGGGVETTYAPSGANFWEMTYTASFNETRIFFDSQATGASTSPVFRTSTGGNAPVLGGAFNKLLLAYANGVFTPGEGFGVSTPEDFIKNEVIFGLDSNKADHSIGSVSPVTQADLVAMGIQNGFKDSVNNNPYAVGYFSKTTTPKSMFVRIYVQTTVANAFGNPRIVLWAGKLGAASIVSSTPLILEKTFPGGMAASFYGVLSPGYSDYAVVGTDHVGSEVLTVCGVQWGFSDARSPWISRTDYDLAKGLPVSDALGDLRGLTAEPDVKSFLCGPDIWLVSGRKQTLHVLNGLSTPAESLSITAAVSVNPASLGKSSFLRTGTEEIVLDPDAIGAGTTATGGIVLRRRGGGRDMRAAAPVTFHVAPATVTASKKILLIGDSLTHRKIAAFLGPKLAAIGITATFVGTVHGQDASGAEDVGPMNEGREGWGWQDFTHQDARMSPVAIGSEASYLAMPYATSNNYNPFIVAGSGAGSFNGYKFDFASYLSRFSVPAPDYVIIMLGTNDIALYGGGALSGIPTAESVIIPNIRAVAPSARIALAFQGRPKSVEGDSIYSYRWPIMQEYIRYVRTAADPNVQLISTWLLQNQECGWDLAPLSTDPVTGLYNAQWADTVHFGDYHRHTIAEALASWIACREAGV